MRLSKGRHVPFTAWVYALLDDEQAAKGAALAMSVAAAKNPRRVGCLSLSMASTPQSSNRVVISRPRRFVDRAVNESQMRRNVILNEGTHVGHERGHLPRCVTRVERKVTFPAKRSQESAPVPDRERKRNPEEDRAQRQRSRPQ